MAKKSSIPSRPPVEADTFEFRMNEYGRFQIIVNGVASESTGYRSIATVTVGLRTFIGASKYFDGTLPTEKVLQILPQETVQGHGELEEVDNDPHTSVSA